MAKTTCKECRKDFTPPPNSKRVYCSLECYNSFRRTNRFRTPGTWKQGQSGNPKGRPPKGYSISDMMKEMLNNNPQTKESLGKVIMDKALKGDMIAIKTLWQYMDGMPKQEVEANLNHQNTFSEAQVERIAERITRGKRSNGDLSSTK